MRKTLLLTLTAGLLALGLITGLPVHAQQNGSDEIIVFSPLPGEAVQGLVQIIGTVDVTGFQSYEIAFAFQDDATQTWFQVASGDAPVIQGVLAEWDTTVLTDSNYNLLLRVHYQNGTVEDLVLESIRVRNYSAIETSTPMPTQASPNQQETHTPMPPTETPIQPTPTDLPPNPAALDSQQLFGSIQRGAIIGAAFITVALLYTRTKQRNIRL